MMENNEPGFGAEKRAENDNRTARTGGSTPSMSAPAQPKKETLGQRWNAVQLSKSSIVWLALAVMALTMLVGFTWGGWVTGGTAQRTATDMANDAVIQRLSSICVAQFQQDPDKDEKLAKLQEARSYEQRNFVKDQGWSTMPGDEESDNKVATACAKVLAQIGE